MYLMIPEDGQIFKAKDITNDDMNASDDGILDIIDIDDMSQYHGGEWHILENWE